MHPGANSHLTGPYPEDEFWDDLLRITGGKTNETLARFAIRSSNNVGEWMEQHGCVFQPAMRGTLHLSRTNGFFLGRQGPDQRLLCNGCPTGGYGAV